MRKLAKKLGYTCAFMCIIPFAPLAYVIGKRLGLDDATILCFELPGLMVQLFGLFMMINYRKEVFNL